MHHWARALSDASAELLCRLWQPMWQTWTSRRTSPGCCSSCCRGRSIAATASPTRATLCCTLTLRPAPQTCATSTQTAVRSAATNSLSTRYSQHACPQLPCRLRLSHGVCRAQRRGLYAPLCTSPICALCFRCMDARCHGTPLHRSYNPRVLNH